MKRVDALLAGWSAHTPAPTKFRELTELARALEAQHAEMYKLLSELEDNPMQAGGAEYKHRLWNLLNHIRGSFYETRIPDDD